MDCHEARRLLNLGTLPGTADPVRTVLGFHLSTCADCRTYRTHLHNQQLLHTLFAEESLQPQVHPRGAASRFSHRAASALRTASTALLVGGMLALTSFADEAPVRAAEAPAAPDMAQVARRPAQAGRIARRSSSSAPQARLVMASQSRAASSASSTPAPTVAQNVAAEGMQSLSLEAGLELRIPALPSSLEEIAAAPAGQPAGPRTYVVQPGDTLSSIALRYYGNASLWNVIYNANVGVIGGNPGLIFAGQQLTIPTVANPTTPPPQTGAGPGIYTVRSGDTLSGIALFAYGNANLWDVIYNANRGLIGGNYNLIFPGQQLTIPAAQTGRGLPGNDVPVINPAPIGAYQVQSGDTLSSIAQRVYGNGNLWYLIYNANLGVISDPDLIYPGQQFTIPALS